MQEQKFTIEIHAPRERVWSTLWDDATFRQWANIIDEGTYMVGELVEGQEIQYISAVNGYGVTSRVERVVPGESLLLRHSADTQDTGKRERAKEWTGGNESYTLTEAGGTTTLTVALDVPTELLDYFQATYPKALALVKTLAEQEV